MLRLRPMLDRTSPARRAVLALLCWLALATGAFAHASLTASAPADGELLDARPATFDLSFTEPVSPLVLRLIAPDGAARDLTDYDLRDQTLRIAAPENLARGTHVLSWRVISADGHPVGGSVVFSVGEASVAPPAVEEASYPRVRMLGWGAKVALYCGLAFGVGGAFALAFVTGGGQGRRNLILTAIALGVAGTILSLAFQGLDALGVALLRITDPLVWRTAWSTSFGWTVAGALAGFALSSASLFAPRLAAGLLSAAALTAAGLALAASGHAAAAEPQWLTRPMVFLHAVAIAFWIGALAPLAAALRRGGPEAGAALMRFSRSIPWAVGALVVAGVVLALIQVQKPSALIDTAYGRTLLTKLALLSALFALALYNRTRLTAPAAAGEPAARRRLARVISVETVLALAIFVTAAGWRFTPPPRALAIAAAQPATEYIHTDKALAFVQVMPGRAGPVDVAVNVLTGEFQVLNAKEVTLVLANQAAGIEPIRRKGVRRGEANWRVNGLVMPVPGRWSIRVDVLITDFDIVRLEGDIVIQP